jgi:UDP-glucose:(heptosyl)LPS alpha-1,3-glucosyltransferase
VSSASIATTSGAPSQHRRLRTLTLVSSDVAPIGGMERVAFELCTRLLRRGWAVTVIARSCAIPAGDGLTFVRLRSPSRPVAVALLSDFVLGAVAVARHRTGILHTVNPIVPNRVDVIQAQFCEAAFRACGVSRASRPTLPYRLNSWLASRIALAMERLCYRADRVRRVVCVSEGLRQDTARWYPGLRDCLAVIPNGVDLAAFNPSREQRRRVRERLGLADSDLVALFVGGDWHRKGLRHAIEALAGADGWTLLVVGSGVRRQFDTLIAARGLQDRVLFVGRQVDPGPYYQAADALVAPSYFEAFSLVLLEAAASGLPLIVPRMNGTEDLVEDGVNGWFTLRDGYAIADRLRTLRDDPDLRAATSAAARRSAQPFDWERITDRFEALYTGLATDDERHLRQRRGTGHVNSRGRTSTP